MFDSIYRSTLLQLMDILYQKCVDLLYKISPLLITRDTHLQLKALHKCVESGHNGDIYAPENALNEGYYEWIAWKNESNALATASASASAGATGATFDQLFKSNAQSKLVRLFLQFLHQLPLLDKPQLPDAALAVPVDNASVAVPVDEASVRNDGKKGYCVIIGNDNSSDFGRVRLRRIK